MNDILLFRNHFITEDTICHKTSYCCPEKTDAGDLENGQKSQSKYIYPKSHNSEYFKNAKNMKCYQYKLIL